MVKHEGLEVFHLRLNWQRIHCGTAGASFFLRAAWPRFRCGCSAREGQGQRGSVTSGGTSEGIQEFPLTLANLVTLPGDQLPSVWVRFGCGRLFF